MGRSVDKSSSPHNSPQNLIRPVTLGVGGCNSQRITCEAWLGHTPLRENLEVQVNLLFILVQTLRVSR